MAGEFDDLQAAMAERYILERELGTGGMATVFLARDARHNRKVAIKILRAEVARLIGADRFLKEIETTANLQHPNILPLFDSGHVDGTVFYVMPYLEGESLRQRLIRERQLPVSDAIRIATDIASALDYAHRHGVIHRDIKPDNVLFQDGRALLADFGIALARSKDGIRITRAGLTVGTPQYMSPEQASGEHEVDPRSDVYSLGAVVYEMLSGQPPFPGVTAHEIFAQVLSEDPLPLATRRRTVPAHVDAAVARALEKLPADRWQTAARFADALNGVGSGELSMVRRQERPVWRSALPWAAAALLLPLAWLGYRAESAVPPPTPAPVRFTAEYPRGAGARMAAWCTASPTTPACGP